MNIFKRRPIEFLAIYMLESPRGTANGNTIITVSKGVLGVADLLDVRAVIARAFKDAEGVEVDAKKVVILNLIKLPIAG